MRVHARIQAKRLKQGKSAINLITRAIVNTCKLLFAVWALLELNVGDAAVVVVVHVDDRRVDSD